MRTQHNPRTGGFEASIPEKSSGYLFVVENRDDPDPSVEGVGVISEVRLGRNLGRGRIWRTIHHELFQVPTTMAGSGGRHYVVNAKFGLANRTARSRS